MRLSPSTLRHRSTSGHPPTFCVFFLRSTAPLQHRHRCRSRPTKAPRRGSKWGFPCGSTPLPRCNSSLKTCTRSLRNSPVNLHRRPQNEHEEAPPHYRRTPPCVPVVLYQPHRKAFTGSFLLRHVPRDAPQGHPLNRPAILAHAQLTQTQSAPACSARRGGLFSRCYSPAKTGN